MAENRAEILAGTAVLAAALGLLVYVGQETGLTERTTDSYDLVASFRSVEGIRVGTDVRLAGVKVGTVTGLDLNPAAFGLGFIIGPVIAFVSLAISDNNYHVPAFVAAAFSFLSILRTTFWFQESLPAEKRGQATDRHALSLGKMFSALTHPAIGILLVLMFAQQLAFGGFEQILSLFTLNRLGLNASGNAVVFVFVGVIVVAVQGGFIGRWSRRYGDRRLIYAALALLAVGLLLIGLTPQANPSPGTTKPN